MDREPQKTKVKGKSKPKAKPRKKTPGKKPKKAAKAKISSPPKPSKKSKQQNQIQNASEPTPFQKQQQQQNINQDPGRPPKPKEKRIKPTEQQRARINELKDANDQFRLQLKHINKKLTEAVLKSEIKQKRVWARNKNPIKQLEKELENQKKQKKFYQKIFQNYQNATGSASELQTINHLEAQIKHNNELHIQQFEQIKQLKAASSINRKDMRNKSDLSWQKKKIVELKFLNTELIKQSRKLEQMKTARGKNDELTAQVEGLLEDLMAKNPQVKPSGDYHFVHKKQRKVKKKETPYWKQREQKKMQDIQWKPKVQRKVESIPEAPTYEQLLSLRKAYYNIQINTIALSKRFHLKSTKVQSNITHKNTILAKLKSTFSELQSQKQMFITRLNMARNTLKKAKASEPKPKAKPVVPPQQRFLKSKRSKYLKPTTETRRSKQGGNENVRGLKEFNDIKISPVHRVRRIKIIKFYYDDLIYGFDVTYSDYKEREYETSHIIFSQYDEKSNEDDYIKGIKHPFKTGKEARKKKRLGKESLMTKTLVLPEWDYIKIVKGEYSTHIYHLVIKTGEGKIFVVGKPNKKDVGSIRKVNTFEFYIYKGERPFSMFGNLAPVRGHEDRYALTMIGMEARVLTKEDKRLELLRPKACSLIQKEWRRTTRIFRVMCFINNRIKAKRNRAARKIQRQWTVHQEIKRKKREGATLIQKYWRRRQRCIKVLQFVAKRHAKRRLRAALKIQRWFRKYMEEHPKEEEEGEEGVDESAGESEEGMEEVDEEEEGEGEQEKPQTYTEKYENGEEV